jgi:hypothetical protein
MYGDNMKVLLLAILFVSSMLGQNEFPASLMEMNNPEYLLKNSGPWTKLENESIILYASNKIEDKVFLQSILDSQTENILHILNILNIKPGNDSEKVFVWIFNDDNEKYLKTQVKSNAHCLSEYHSVYYNKNNALGAHELGHYLIEANWGQLKSKKYEFLFNEGFAFLVDEGKFFKKDYYLLAKDYLKDKRYSIDSISNESPGDYKKKAFVSASFLKYLIKIYGIELFEKLWKHIKEDKSVFVLVYGKSFQNIKKEYYSFIKKYTKSASR